MSIYYVSDTLHLSSRTTLWMKEKYDVYFMDDETEDKEDKTQAVNLKPILTYCAVI